MRTWLGNVVRSVQTIAQGLGITWEAIRRTYQRKAYTEVFEYPEVPIPVKPRYRGFHRFDLTTCIGCDKCAVACPVDCIYIEKEKSPVGKGFRVNGFVIDYSKCMFCALCVDPCPVDCIFMGSNHDLSGFSRDSVVVDFAKLPLEVAWGQASLNPTAVVTSKVIDAPVWVKGETVPDLMQFIAPPKPTAGATATPAATSATPIPAAARIAGVEPPTAAAGGAGSGAAAQTTLAAPSSPPGSISGSTAPPETH